MKFPEIKLIAMYLPQFHQIHENDEWWGNGFTEWANVRRAQPRFPGHYQPHVPGELGYYDLRDPSARKAQADIARKHGIYGFCYYHYWFNGKRLLETPFNEVLRTGEPNFPFCLCWANENWTRRWDGADQEVLMAQHYTDSDSLEFINELVPAFRDERYIRVNGKPLLLVYRTHLLPNPKRTVKIWREAMHQAGIGDLYLVRVENHLDGGKEINPVEIGFDAAMEFAPYWGSVGKRVTNLSQVGFEAHQVDEDVIAFDYQQCMINMLCRPNAEYKLFRGIFPMWDNTARRKREPLVFVNSSPEKYAYWLSLLLKETVNTFVGDERLVFVNAWNEWGEGCHLEPDQRHGAKYLEATRNALANFEGYRQLLKKAEQLPGLSEEARECICDFIRTIHCLNSDLNAREVLLAEKIKDNYNKDQALELLMSEKKILETVVDGQRLEVAILKDKVASKQLTIDELLGSLSWKLTRPLRFVHSKLVGNSVVRKSVDDIVGKYKTPFDYYLSEKLIEDVVAGESEFDVIVLPVIDWHFRFQRPQQLSCHMAQRGHRVFYLATSFASCWEEPGFVMQESPHEGVYVIQLNCSLPHPLNIYQDCPSPSQRDFLAASLAQLCDVCHIKNLVTIVDLPFWAPIVSKIPDHVVVYDCMDHHQGFSTNKQKMLVLEKDLMHAADLVITTSQRLSDIVLREVPNTIIRNGADVLFFARIPSELAFKTHRPIVGYFGAISDWFDMGLVIESAQKYHDWEFVLVGSTSGCNLSNAKKLLNIKFVGEVPYADLPSYLHLFDICIIPFKLTELTLCTNPVKVYEYLSAGKPVVTTAMPELKLISDQVHVANSDGEFLDMLKLAMDESSDKMLAKQRAEWAQQHDWSSRVAQLEAEINALLVKKGRNQ